MDENLDTFERLVISLESSERQDLLKQLADKTEIRSGEGKDGTSAAVLLGEASHDPAETFHEQPFLARLWFILMSLFTSVTPVGAYSASLVSSLGRKISRNCSSHIDVRKRLYTDTMYRDMVRLGDVQDFFSTLLSAYENNKGDFYIVLSQLLMKNTSELIARAADPFVESYEREQTIDIRLSCLRKLDAAFMEIQEDERARMYQAAQGIEWMRRFCLVPIGRILIRFNVMSDLLKGCPIDSVNEEMKALVSCFVSARKIPTIMLEAMFLFSVQDKAQNIEFDIEKECASFLSTASAHLTGIREFKTTVPLADFVRFAANDTSWSPSLSEGGEDWFMLFKTAWKKRFDERWGEWNRLHRSFMLRKRMIDFLGCKDLPVLTSRPWEGLWLSLSLRRELSFIFLKGFFMYLYPTQVMKPLKLVLIEGDFYRRENLAEYTDSFSALEHQQVIIETFENRLTEKGDIGEGFLLIVRDKIATVKGKARLENLMLTTESEVELMISRTLAAFRSIDLILGGILEVSRGGPYETLSNLAMIQGKRNEQFRKELGSVKHILREASSLLNDIEIVEKESR